MASQQQLQSINTDQAPNNADSQFHLFPKLPAELRAKIWRSALCRPRLFRVHLSRGALPPPKAISAEGPLAGLERMEGNHTSVSGIDLLSKFLRVSSEARREALRFHRVHLPCRFNEGLHEDKGKRERRRRDGILYINPEWDVIDINAMPPATENLIDFFYHFKAVYDPHHIGLLNLALGCGRSTFRELAEIEPSDVRPKPRSAFLDTLRQIREVWFNTSPCLSSFEPSGTVLNQTFPIMTSTPTFEIISCDPRPITRDVLGLQDLCGPETLSVWLRMLKRWQFPSSGKVYRFLLAADSALMEDFVNYMDDFSRERGGTTVYNHIWRYPPRGKQEAATKPAFGFWLFPLNSLVRLDENGQVLDERIGSRAMSRAKLMEYPPMLALSSSIVTRHRWN